MDSVDGRSEVLASIDASLCCDPGIVFVVAFGSRIDGDARPSSDLDLAIKFADGLSPRERFRKRCFLAGDLQRAAEPHVDVTDIETLPIDVAYDAVNGELLCGDETAFQRFETDVETTFESRREKRRQHQRDVIDRIAEDGLRG